MKYLKVVVPLLVVAFLLTALPAAADDPFGGPPSKDSGKGTTTWDAVYVGDNGCWTGDLAAGASMWFKGDAFQGNHQRIWLDDELPGATTPSGIANFSTLNYMRGTAPGSAKEANAIDGAETVNMVQGFAFRVYGPNALKPNYSFAGQNMWILTDAQGRPGAGSAPQTGWGAYNKFQPAHLLWYEARMRGWYYVRVHNQMVNSGTFSLCTYRDSY